MNVDQGVSSNVATIKAVDSANKVTNFELKTNIESMLEVNDIIIYVNNHEEKSVNDDNEKLKDIEPGDKIELRFQLENHFHKDYDEGDIDGDIEITLEDNDFGDDVDESADFKIDADEKFDDEDSEIVLSFTVPKDVDEGNYDLEILVEGKDDNKAKYETKWTLEIDVERERDDLRLEGFTVTPSEVSCSRDVTITTKVVNLGRDEQKYGAVSFTNSNLGLNKKIDFSIDSGTSRDNELLKSHIFTVGDNVKAGSYSIIGTTYFDYTTISNKEFVTLKVKDCETVKKTEPETKKEETKKQVTTGTSTKGTTSKETKSTEATENNKITSAAIVKTQESSPYTLEDAFIGLIVLAMIIIIVMITISMVLLFKR